MSKKDILPQEVLHERVSLSEEEKKETEDLVMARLYIREFDEKMISDAISLSMIEGKKEIYMVSPGGLASVATILIDLVNDEPENYTIKVSEQISSAAFLTILNVRCKVVDIAPNMLMFSAFMTHDTSTSGRIPKQIKKLGKKANQDMYNAIKHVLTNKQRKYYENCHKLYKLLPFMKHFIYEDLYLTRDQMKQLLGDRFSLSGEEV